MNWIENVLILGGISLEIFAAMECQGSLVAKVNKKHLAQIGIFMTLWQAAALFIGTALSKLFYLNEMAYDERYVGLILAAVIFFGLGIRFLVKAVKNERVNEHLEKHLDFKRFVRMAAACSIYTLLAGMAFGFLGTNVALMLIIIAALTILVVVSGMYTGYHFGFEHKRKAYIGGAVLFFIAGADVILRYMI